MNYRFSGHETFPCRYAWLPKAYLAIQANSAVFSDEEAAMVALGVGKNMMRACRFWVIVTGIARMEGGRFVVTDLGRLLLDPENGLDPYLEDIRTLWLIHWQLSSQVHEPLFAWDYLLNRWPHMEMTRSSVLAAFLEESQRLERKLSIVTLEQHFDTFLHTYVPTRSRKGEVLEDNLDCPLVELELIQKSGERPLDDGGKREVIYAFRREAKSEISAQLFLYCLNDFWMKHVPNEMTMTFRELSVGHGSPGQLLKLPEWDIRERLESLTEDSSGVFRYQESAAQAQVVRTSQPDGLELLRSIYTHEEHYA